MARKSGGKASKGKARGDDAARLPALELRERLGSGQALARCYLLLGEEGWLRSEAAAAVAAAALGPDPGPSLSQFDGARVELSAVLDEVRTLPFFGAGRRVVVVKDAGSRGQAGGFVGDHGEALAAFVAEAPASAVLVLEAAKVNQRFKGSKALLGCATVVDCAPFDEGGLLAFLRLRARAWGREFARGADLALLERLGGHDVPLAQIDAEVRKLASSGTGPVTAEEVVDLASCGSSEESFALIDRVARGDAAGTLELLQVIFRDGLLANGERQRDPSGIAFMLLGMLRWDLGRLLRGRALLEQGFRPFQIASELRVFRDKERFLERLQRGDRLELGWRHAALRQADAALKVSGDPRQVMTDLLLRLARRERPARALAR